MSNSEDQDGARLWEHILVQTYGTTDLIDLEHLPLYPEAHAFFQAIDAAFTSSDKMHGRVPVDRELLQYMAAWGRDMAQGYEEKGGPIGAHANHCLRRAFRGFVETLREAIKLNKIRSIGEGRVMYGCFVVPLWLVRKYLNEAQADAEYLNKLWENEPGCRQFIAT